MGKKSGPLAFLNKKVRFIGTCRVARRPDRSFIHKKQWNFEIATTISVSHAYSVDNKEGLFFGIDTAFLTAGSSRAGILEIKGTRKRYGRRSRKLWPRRSKSRSSASNTMKLARRRKSKPWLWQLASRSLSLGLRLSPALSPAVLNDNCNRLQSLEST